MTVDAALPVVLAGLVGLAIAYGIARLQELGRSHQASANARRHEELEGERRAAEALKAESARRAEAEAKLAELASIAGERIGAQFIERKTRDDVGLRLTVTRLDPRQPLQRVIVNRVPEPGRVPTEFDPVPIDGEFSIEWRALTESPAAQRHLTARLIVDSYDDNDGWVTYQRVPFL